MPTFLQPVDVPKRCFLQEVLYWVAFQRLPIAAYTLDGKEIRETDEAGGYDIEIGDPHLTPDETTRAGIPSDPNWVAILEDKPTLPVAHYDRFLARNDLDDGLREKLATEREAAIVHERDCEAWSRHYERAIEYPASRIFVALKGGLLRASGRLLPDPDIDVALSKLESEDRAIYDLPLADIPPAFWSLQGIDFNASAAENGANRYCHISCRMDDVLSVFPAEGEDVHGIRRVGDSFVLIEGTNVARSSSRPGRPSYPWDAFHLEAASLLKRNEFPTKKEAAIEHFRSWFEREHGIKASRSVVGEKLKPYYDRFLRSGGQKIR